MTLSRSDVPWRVALAVGRPVRWVPTERAVGDYDGRERTLEIFMVNAGEQRDTMRRLRALRTDVETAAGGPVVVVFHTVAETTRLYPEMLSAGLLREARLDAVGREYAVRIVRLDESVVLQHGPLTCHIDGVAA